MTHAAITTGTVCRDCAHFILSPGLERDGWEAALGTCRHWHDRVQPADSQPLLFGCGEWTPAVGPHAASGR